MSETPAAIAGSFADYRLVKSRSVLQVIVEIPIEQQGAAFAALGYPLPGTEIPVAVARLNADPTRHLPAPVVGDRSGATAGETAPKDRRPWETLSPQQQAGILCSDVAFQKFVAEKEGILPSRCDEHDAAAWLRFWLGVESRKEIAANPEAIAKLNDIRAEFLEWAGRVPVAVR